MKDEVAEAGVKFKPQTERAPGSFNSKSKLFVQVTPNKTGSDFELKSK